MRRYISAIVATAVLGSLWCGCAQNPKITPGAADALGLLAVRHIKLQPFTKVKSFDDDKVPDGIAAVVLPTDQFGDPVKIVGHIYFEVYTYQAASGERRGKRLEFWERTLATPADQKLYWDRTAQMYQFPLAWTQGPPSTPTDKLILTVVYRTPWDETLEDEMVLEFSGNKRQLAAPDTKAQ